MSSGNVIIYTDGACSGNPGPGGWGSIVVFPDGTVRELGDGERTTTNNRMEMTAAIEALAAIKPNTTQTIVLYTDSQYMIRGITEWIRGWRARGWRNAEGKDVANRDLWEELDRQTERLRPTKIDWKYVPGHSGFPGNERCDQIAVGFATGRTPDLYQGNRESYTVDVDQVPTEKPLSAAKPATTKTSSGGGYKKAASNGGGTSYLSNIGGVVMRHSTWSACEQRVKGKSNAKFKKTKSSNEERETLASWGLDPATAVTEDR